MLGPTIQRVLIPGSLTIPSTWQLLKISLVMNSFLIHRQSHLRMFKVPRCPQHSKYLFWNVSQKLHLLIAQVLLWSRPVNKYGLESASQISCCLCHSYTQLDPSLLEIVFQKMHIFPLFFLHLLENERFSLTHCDSARL